MARAGSPGAGFELDLLLAYAMGKTPREAAKETGHPERTVGRRWADPAFRAAAARHRSAFLSRAVGKAAAKAAALATEAVEELARLLTHRNPWLRLQAARAVLEVGSRLVSDVDFADRLGELERRFREEGDGDA